MILSNNNMIESLSTAQVQKTYWPSSEWKNLVWHCRTSSKFPTRLRKFRQACLIIGTIAKNPNKAYFKMNSPDQIDEHCVLKTKDGRDAVQYTFLDDEGQELLELLEKTTGSLTVYPVSAVEVGQWEEEHKAELELHC
jgi:hypothetical protein